MKRIIIPIISLIVLALSACKSSDEKSTWEKYADWREQNVTWMEEQSLLKNPDGTPMYEKVVAEWNSNAYVLMRWFNDRALTQGNYTPIYTSTVDVKYIGRLITDLAFDSSYTSITPADSISQFKVSGVIPGWTIALCNMHVGDSVEVLIPYQQAYGSSAAGADIRPYSTLRFNMKLTNVYEYVRPQ